MHKLAPVLCAVLLALLAVCSIANDEEAKNEGWIPLFNGKNLDGWKIKVRGSDLGENYKQTFRVEDGLLKVSYDEYTDFGGEFGHIFHEDKYSHYRLRVEYRFVGKQTRGGPGWALRNSGIMLHCQAPPSMRKDQDFPVSVEVQLLGGDGKNERSTANVCTPGTHIVMDGKLVRQHCNGSQSKTFHGEQWVTAEVEVRGGTTIRHFVNGELVLGYEKPQLDEGDADAKKLMAGADKILTEGYIALQAERHPVHFRKVEILPLGEEG